MIGWRKEGEGGREGEVISSLRCNNRGLRGNVNLPVMNRLNDRMEEGGGWRGEEKGGRERV